MFDIYKNGFVHNATGPYFFEKAAGGAMNVNCDWYRQVIFRVLWSELVNIDIEDIWF